VGGSRKVQHCGLDRSAVVGHKDGGYTMHCFRCKASHFEPHGERGMHEIMATRRAVEKLDDSAYIPDNAVPIQQGPLEARLWVLIGGLTPEDATDLYGMRWHAESNRVLIPTSTTSFLARSVFNEHPKYRMYGSCVGYKLGEAQNGPTRSIVVVEDILSAIAVNRAGWPSFALLGTSVSPEMAVRIADGAETVIGWFDYDAAGAQCYIKLRKAMRLYPVYYSSLHTEYDPKCYHRSQIKLWVDQHSRRGA